MTKEVDPLSSENDRRESGNESSPEAAGVARGALKTATGLSRRAVVGRLPKPTSPPIAVPRTPMPRVLPKKVPIRRVARASDRLSTGFDAYEAVSSTMESGDKRSKQSRLQNLVKRSISFSGTLLRNTIIGAGAFEAYDWTIQWIGAATVNDRHWQAKGGDDAYSRASVVKHFGAGIVAGSAHSLVSMGFQSAAFLHQNGLDRQRVGTVASISSWTLAHTVHHSLAYAMLFSSYEFFKRLLEFSSSDNKYADTSMSHVASVGFAGGIAGQVQHVTSHYTEVWLHVSEEQSVKTYLQDRRRFSNFRFFQPGPSIRSTILAFPPCAIGFIAYEFGRQDLMQ